MPIEDVLDWVDRRYITGTLLVERPAQSREFIFHNGTLVQSSSDERGEQIDRLLLRAGLIDQDILQRAMQTQAETGMSLQRILMIVGAVGEEQLRRVLSKHARELVVELISWSDGTFILERGDDAFTDEPVLAVKLRPCIEEGRRRARRWNHIRALIPSDDINVQVIARQRLFGVADSTKARHEITELVGALDQGMKIAELIKHSGNRFAVLDRLAQLIERGALAMDQEHAMLAEPDSSGPRTVEDMVVEARRMASAGDHSSGFDLARQALAQEPSNGAVQRLFRELERAVFAELSRELLTTFRVPRLLVARDELDSYELSDAERYLAGRIDGRWDLLSLMRVSPLGEVEALITFKRLADRGIISLS